MNTSAKLNTSGSQFVQITMWDCLNLLSLLGGIRNGIYEFALTAAEGIQYVKWFQNRPVFSATDSSSSLRIEFNQIKFVNR
jgi:hypothetical protein